MGWIQGIFILSSFFWSTVSTYMYAHHTNPIAQQHLLYSSPNQLSLSVLLPTTMGVQKTGSTHLNPNAPMFVPMAYRSVEDFSEQWWDLVQSCPSFRDYWIQDCFNDDDYDYDYDEEFYDPFPILPDLHTFIQLNNATIKKKEKHGGGKDLVALEVLEWRKSRVVVVERAKCSEKAPKIVNVKLSPRPIQQPR